MYTRMPSLHIAFPCEHCSKETIRRGPTQRFCSVECQKADPSRYTRWKRQHGIAVEIPCPVCETIFKPSLKGARKFCSAACRKEARRRKGILQAYGESGLIAHAKTRCDICNRPRNEKSAIDHDHFTGQIRGLLCYHCNLMLGHAKDDPVVLIAAAEYLLR